ncbi:MAG: zf-HC2 domain-containing protein [Deltaproteobacteria bacterium]|uniref:Zf-HC2 domain-containing protein n=1 Tax=Candidatus Zymogenus saltonus TaxID=2844893 RepID=A0A9D8PNB0_9DELT|nr:zf-HC2 domain-containing protein [Candidatus Zymogenus saltonus]
MKCSTVKKIIPDYLLGELSEIEAKSVEKHIEACPECSGELKSLREVFDDISSSGAKLPPEYYFERFPSRVMERFKKSNGSEIAERRRLLSPVWAAVAVAAVILLMVFVLVNPVKPPVTSETGGVNIVEVYENGLIDQIDPIIEVSEAYEASGDDPYYTSSYTDDYLDDYYIDEETVNAYIEAERYYITEEEFEEILQILKKRFLS